MHSESSSIQNVQHNSLETTVNPTNETDEEDCEMEEQSPVPDTNQKGSAVDNSEFPLVLSN